MLFTRRHADGAVSADVLLPDGTTKTILENAAQTCFVPPRYLVFARRGILFGADFDTRSLNVGATPVRVLDGVAGRLSVSRAVSYSSDFTVSSNGSIAYVPGPIMGRRTSSIGWLDLAGTYTALAFPTAAYSSALPFNPPRPSPDTSSCLVTAYPNDTATEAELWLGDITRGTWRTLATGNVESVAWMLGRREAIYRKAHGGVFRRAVDFSGPEAEVAGAAMFAGFARATIGDVSPDGTVILLARSTPASAGQAATADIWLLTGLSAQATPRSAGDVKLQALAKTSAREDAPRVSPDGRLLAYWGSDPGVLGLYVRLFPNPGPVVQIDALPSAGGLYAQPPSWRGNDVLVYSTGNKINAVQVSFGPKLRTRPAQVPAGGAGLQQFLVVRNAPRPDPPAEIHVIVNWIEEIKKKLAAVK